MQSPSGREPWGPAPASPVKIAAARRYAAFRTRSVVTPRSAYRASPRSCHADPEPASSPGSMRAFTETVPLFVPVVVLSITLATVAAGRTAAWMNARPAVSWLLLVGFGVILAATLTPLRDAIEHGLVSSGTCDLRRIGPAPLGAYLRPNETSANVVLFHSPGTCLGHAPRLQAHEDNHPVRLPAPTRDRGHTAGVPGLGTRLPDRRCLRQPARARPRLPWWTCPPRPSPRATQSLVPSRLRSLGSRGSSATVRSGMVATGVRFERHTTGLDARAAGPHTSWCLWAPEVRE